MRTTFLGAVAFAVLLGLFASTAFAAEAVAFRSAKPIWLKDREKEMNLLVGFRAAFDAPADGKAILQVAAATIYRAWINGEFLGAGPARGPHGYYRVDQWDLDRQVEAGQEPRGRRGGRLQRPTATRCWISLRSFRPKWSRAMQGAGIDRGRWCRRFIGRACSTARVQKAQRYSFQRAFSEVYRLTPEVRCVGARDVAFERCLGRNRRFSRRRSFCLAGCFYSESTRHAPVKLIGQGRVEPIEEPAELPGRIARCWALARSSRAFQRSELTTIPSVEAQKFQSIRTASLDVAVRRPPTPSRWRAREFRNVRLGRESHGLPVGAKITCARKRPASGSCSTRFSPDNDVDFKRMGCVNLSSATSIEPGDYQVESIEPYTLRYLKLLVRGRIACSIENVYLREFAHPKVQRRVCHRAIERLDRVFAAGVETFRQNAFDVFMDCPSRERAGWLCDSFFTSRVAADLDGNTPGSSSNFVESFLLAEGSSSSCPTECYRCAILRTIMTACSFRTGRCGLWCSWRSIKVRSGDVATVEAIRPRDL